MALEHLAPDLPRLVAASEGVIKPKPPHTRAEPTGAAESLGHGGGEPEGAGKDKCLLLGHGQLEVLEYLCSVHGRLDKLLSHLMLISAFLSRHMSSTMTVTRELGKKGSDLVKHGHGDTAKLVSGEHGPRANTTRGLNAELGGDLPKHQPPGPRVAGN